jgi:hypothetical protein
VPFDIMSPMSGRGPASTWKIFCLEILFLKSSMI